MLIEKEITNGKYKLIYSRRFPLANSDSLEIKLALDDLNDLLLKFSFKIEKDKKPSLKTEEIKIDNGFGYHFILENFNNVLGTGLTSPMTIMNHTINGVEKDICITFFVYKNSDANPLIDIGLYEEI
jgi:hypothetical protein